MKRLFQQQLQRLAGACHATLATPPFDDALAQLQAWYETKQGRQTLHRQTQWVNEQVGEMFGYHLMQMGIMPTSDFYTHSRIHHRFHVSPLKTPVNNKKSISILQASPTRLPLADESIDVLIMHHALDFSESPHQVLSEATRVIAPNGYIIIMGFNPFSLWGCVQLCKRPFSRQPIYKPQYLRAGRVQDWLALLNVKPLTTHYAPTGWLGQNMHKAMQITERYVPRLTSYLWPLSTWFTSLALPIGGMYFIVARKDKACITPLKPAWQKNHFLGVRAITQKAGGATAKEHYADILPLRLPNRK